MGHLFGDKHFARGLLHIALEPDLLPKNLLFFMLQPISAIFSSWSNLTKQKTMQANPEVSQDTFRFAVGAILVDPWAVFWPLGPKLAIFGPKIQFFTPNFNLLCMNSNFSSSTIMGM